MNHKKILLGFFILYFLLLVFTTDFFVFDDEGAQSMDSFFYFNLFKDITETPSIIRNLKEYAFNFYAQYPALYIIYHPPLYNLITAGLFTVFGVNFFTVKLTSMFFSLGTLFLVYLLGRELFNEKIALSSVFITAFASYFFFFSKLAMLDIPLTFFVLLSIYFFYKAVHVDKKNFYYLGISLGIGFLIRYHIMIIIPALLVYLFYEKKIKENLPFILKSGLLFLGISLPYWIVLFFFRGMESVLFWLERTGLYRCDFFCPTQNWLTHLYYYPLVMFYETFPLIFLFPLFFFLWRRRFRREELLLFIIIITYFIFTGLVSLKQPKYILPTIPLFSILFTRASYKIKKYSKPLIFVGLIGQIVMCMLFPYPLVYQEEINTNYELAAEYINDNINESSNIFLMHNPQSNGFIFHFALLNNFNNGIVRYRDCFHQNMSKGEVLNHLDEYNIEYLVNDDTPLSHEFHEIVDENFDKVAEKGNLNIFKRKDKTEFQEPNRICNYNCKLQINLCTEIS